MPRGVDGGRVALTFSCTGANEERTVRSLERGKVDAVEEPDAAVAAAAGWVELRTRKRSMEDRGEACGLKAEAAMPRRVMVPSDERSTLRRIRASAALATAAIHGCACCGSACALPALPGKAIERVTEGA